MPKARVTHHCRECGAFVPDGNNACHPTAIVDSVVSYPRRRRPRGPRAAPIQLTRAWTQRGWSSCDHLIDDSRLAEIIGRSYTTVAHAARAARARADRRGFVAFEYSLAGRRYQYDDSALLGIPGRRVPLITELVP